MLRTSTSNFLQEDYIYCPAGTNIFVSCQQRSLFSHNANSQGYYTTVKSISGMFADSLDYTMYKYSVSGMSLVSGSSYLTIEQDPDGINTTVATGGSVIS